jgi:hypothetical protein
MILGSPLRQSLKLGKVATDESQLLCPAPAFKFSFGCYGSVICSNHSEKISTTGRRD